MSALVRVCVSLSVASHISEASEAIADKFDTVTTSVTRMHQVLTILTLTSIQDHTDLNYEHILYSTSSVISETVHVCCEDKQTTGLDNRFSVP